MEKQPPLVEQKKSPHILTLMFLTCAYAFVVVLISPALPELAEYFSVSKNHVKQIITWFIIGFIPAVIFYAPFSNRFGRKNTLYFGFSVAILGTVVMMLAGVYKNFILINVGRFIQGFGAIVGMQVSVTLIGDCLQGHRARVAGSYIMLLAGISPGIGIAVGAFLCNFDWRYCNYFVALFFLLQLLVSKFFVWETLVEKQSIELKSLCKGYFTNLKVPEVVLAGGLAGTGASLLYIFPSVSAFIVLQELSYSQNVFALWNFIPPIGTALGSIFSIAFVKRFSHLAQTVIGVFCISLTTILYFIFFYWNILNLYTLFLTFTLTLFGVGTISSNAVGYAVKFAPDKAKGSSVLAFLSYASSSCFMVVISLVKSKSIFLMPFFFAVSSLICCILVFVLRLVRKSPPVG